MSDKEELKEFVTYGIPISLMIISWFLFSHFDYGLNFKQSLIKFAEFIKIIFAMCGVYVMSKCFIIYLIKKIEKKKQ